MSLPLLRRSGSVCLLGDDLEFLETVSNGLRRHWHTTLFHEPQLLLRRLKQEHPLWEADAWIQQQIVRKWSGANVSLAAELIDYWSKHTERFTLTRVCVVDQAMPRATGLQVIRHLEGRNGLRVLLMGGADPSIVVAAFNNGLIDRYAQKQTVGLPHIVDLVRELQDKSDSRLDQIWRATLSPEQGIALRRPGVARSLAEYLRPRFAEYVLIGRPFGVLGLSASGKLGWVSLIVVARAGPVEVADAELRGELGLRAASSKVASAVVFGHGASGVAGAFFPVHGVLGKDAGYSKWLAKANANARP